MKCIIAGHVVAFDLLSEESGGAIEAYRYAGDQEPETTFSVTPEALRTAEEEWLALYRSEIEEFMLSRQFCMWLAQHDGLYLHSAAVAYQGRAYVFTAAPGTGKSTHAHLWRQAFGRENVEILNDDKPFVCRRDGAFFVCGSPWCGKEKLQTNRMVPLQAICFLEQGRENAIREVAPSEAVTDLLKQTLLPEGQAEMDKLLTLADELLERVPLYRLRCNISEEAARLAFETMRPKDDKEARV